MKRLIFILTLTAALYTNAQQWSSVTNGNIWNLNTENVGIGTTSPQYKLDVNGTAQIQRLFISMPNNTINWNNIWQSGFYDSYNGSAAPESGWFWGINMGHESNQPSYRYGGQIVIKNANTSPTMYFRSINVNGEGTWAKILHNYGNQDINGNLTVDGTIRAKEIRVQTNVWSDFVFERDYKLRSLAEVQHFINTNGHLPEIPSATEVQENGINLADMNAKLLQKVEELTLYVIELNKEIQELKNKER